MVLPPLLGAVRAFGERILQDHPEGAGAPSPLHKHLRVVIKSAATWARQAPRRFEQSGVPADLHCLGLRAQRARPHPLPPEEFTDNCTFFS